MFLIGVSRVFCKLSGEVRYHAGQNKCEEVRNSLKGQPIALNQTEDICYDMEMKNDSIENIMKLGTAFSGRKVKIKTRR